MNHTHVNDDVIERYTNKQIKRCAASLQQDEGGHAGWAPAHVTQVRRQEGPATLRPTQSPKGGDTTCYCVESLTVMGTAFGFSGACCRFPSSHLARVMCSPSLVFSLGDRACLSPVLSL